MSTPRLMPPVTYQGGKRRQAPEIVDLMLPDLLAREGRFYELCAGSGAVSLELLYRGFPASRMTMVDAGPWGDLWRAFGEGAFPLRTFKLLAARAAGYDSATRQAWLRSLVGVPTSPQSRLAVFLLLQGHSFGGIAVTESVEGVFDTPGLMLRPMAASCIEHTTRLARYVRGVTGRRCNVSEVDLSDAACVYIDPPYVNTAGYGSLAVDIPALAARCPAPLYVSEGVTFEGASRTVKVDSVRTGYLARRDAPDEWVSIFDRPLVPQARGG